MKNQVKAAIEQKKIYGTDQGTEGWDNRKRLLYFVSLMQKKARVLRQCLHGTRRTD